MTAVEAEISGKTAVIVVEAHNNKDQVQVQDPTDNNVDAFPPSKC